MFKGSQSVVFPLALAALVAAPAFGQSPVASKASTSSSVAASAPAVAASGSEFKIKGPPTDLQRGTIGSITDLAQQLKVEQLKRDLREAKQTAASTSTEAALAKVNATPVPGAKVAVAPQEAQERLPPRVSAILGMGGRLRARLHDGRELVSGQEAQGWTVNSVTPSAVSFTHCPAPKKSGAKSECVTKLISPSSI